MADSTTNTLNGDKVTIREVYQLVDQKSQLLEVKIEKLEGKFDLLEAGRLSRLEKDFANMQGKMAIVAGVVSIAISIAMLVLNRII